MYYISVHLIGLSLPKSSIFSEKAEDPLSVKHKLVLMFKLLPYMAPLAIVYFGEYLVEIPSTISHSFRSINRCLQCFYFRLIRHLVGRNTFIIRSNNVLYI